MSKIEIISSCLVKTSTNHDSRYSTMELTPWDLSFLPLVPIQKGILFHKPNPQQFSDENNNTTLIHHLKTSLSQTLDLFPPLAGRLNTTTNPNDSTTVCYFLDCNNAGVQFVHAVGRGVSVSDILDPVYIPAEKLVQSLFTLNGLPNYKGVSTPLLGVQVTELSDGLFISFTMNHSVADGNSFWHFFNSWAEISRGLTTLSKSPVFERWFPSNVPNDNRFIPIPPLILDDEPKNAPKPPLLEKLFSFGKENVAKLKAKANSEAGSTENKISSLQALAVHLWRAVVRGRRLNNQIAENQEVDLGILIGGRARIPLPDGYFGNAVHGAGLVMSEKELLGHELGWASLKLYELVARQTGEVMVKLAENWVQKPVLWSTGKYSFVVSSSPRHNVYGCDFGWGKPIAVRSGMGQKYDGKMTFYPAPEPGGIDVEVCLAPETMKAMENDAEFMAAVPPTILI